VHEVRAAGVGREPLAREREGLRITVDAHERDLRERLQHRFGVPAETQRGVDVHGIGPGQGRTQQLEAPLELYGYVNPPRHGRPPSYGPGSRPGPCPSATGGATRPARRCA
jgi:hypothetical protein